MQSGLLLLKGYVANRIVQMRTPTTLDQGDLFSEIARQFDLSDAGQAYSLRNDVRSAARLTITDEETVALVAEYLAPQISGKTVVEVGCGIGLLALHMSTIAKRVFCIEANPLWSSTFVELLLERKPRNLSYLFGSASEFVGSISGDVAVFCSHSGVEALVQLGRQFAPNVIDVYGQLVESNPDAFDAFAREARKFA